MQPRTLPESVLPADWTEVLQTVEQALEQAVAAAWQREQELPETSSPPNLASGGEDAWQQGWQRLEERLQGLQAVARQAEQGVAEIDALLQTAEVALRRWLAVAQTNGQNLAEGGGPEV